MTCNFSDLQLGQLKVKRVTETVPGQAMLKWSQPSPIMPLHHIRKAIHFFSPVLFVPSLYYTFSIRRIIIYLYIYIFIRFNRRFIECTSS